jgi:hypothetical protein
MYSGSRLQADCSGEPATDLLPCLVSPALSCNPPFAERMQEGEAFEEAQPNAVKLNGAGSHQPVEATHHVSAVYSGGCSPRVLRDDVYADRC